MSAEADRIVAKLGQLRTYLGYLEGYRGRGLDELRRDHTLRGAIERYLQLAAEAVLDVCDMVIVKDGLKRPEEYRQAIIILGESGVLPVAFAERLAPLAGFRNILVHEYAEVDLAQVHRHLRQDLPDLDRFVREIQNHLRGMG